MSRIVKCRFCEHIWFHTYDGPVFCPECRTVIPDTGYAPARFRCSCGREFVWLTNSTAPVLSMECPRCGEEMVSRWVPKHWEYRPTSIREGYLWKQKS